MKVTKQRLMKDPTHKRIYDVICECLRDFGEFYCDWVLKKIGLNPVSEIHWKPLAKYAAEANNMKLIPMVESGYGAGKGRNKTLMIADGDNNPGRHLVHGGRRRPSGWTSVANLKAAPAVRARVAIQRKVSVAVAASADDTELRLNRAFRQQELGLA